MSTATEKDTCLPQTGTDVSRAEMKSMSPQQNPEPGQAALQSALRSRQRAGHRESLLDPEAEKHKRRQDALVGQMKAAEARSRVRLMRLRYQSMRSQEIKHLISCQPTGQRAVRLELLLPVKTERFSPVNALDKRERRRIEEILEDDRGLTINRT
ncbi:protein LKAAEAR1 [Amia ocellicauda]|uniref:protein LKAAEAR1 n=1 Tax=Amia ocellicauda TaxID=2972642 RepID=UPI0034644201